jgi:signal-transduction protein with cAMP-binding, CBS, and nucleotidyltransferase domain
LLTAIGVASLVSEYAEGLFSQKLEQVLTSLYFREKLLFWSANQGSNSSSSVKEKTVEEVMATKARLYVRHTLPLRQAKRAMVSRGSPAAVVVDDNFTPMGLVYLGDIEAELVKEELLLEEDNNFGRRG